MNCKKRREGQKKYSFIWVHLKGSPKNPVPDSIHAASDVKIDAWLCISVNGSAYDSINRPVNIA